MNSSYEDVFFYLDLTKDILKKKDLIKAIKFYIAEKNKGNLKGHYGLLIFQEEGNPIFITDKKDSEIIIKAIEENWKTRPRKQSFFENGLFYIFSYIAETVRKKSKFNRIIIVTDTPSDLSEDYTDALFNLVSKIKNFPTFIDILRISQSGDRFFKDDVKLNILANDTKGGIFYIHDKKEFASIINKLIKTKQLISIFEDQPVKVRISREDYDFYSNLAREVKFAPIDEPGLKCFFCKEEICPVCTNINDTLLLCPQCKTNFHNCCVTNYTIQHNIGIPHIFRCPKCDILLKIQQDDIVSPEDFISNSAEEYLEHTTVQYSEELIAAQEMKSKIPINNLYKKKPSNTGKSLSPQPKVVRIGGFFGKSYTVRKEGDKIVYQRVSKTSSEPDSKISREASSKKTEISLEKVTNKISYWKPPKIEEDVKMNPEKYICPQCGTQITVNEKKEKSCPFCGHIFEE